MKKLFLPLMVVALLPAAAAAKDVRVSYAGLDLRSPAGVAELDRRLDRAFQKICPPAPSIELRRRAAVARCHRVLAKSVAAQRDRVIASASASEDVALSAR